MKKIFCDGQISKCFQENKLSETNRFKYNAEHGSLTLWKEGICSICDREVLLNEPVMIVDVVHTPWNHLIFMMKPRPAPPTLTTGISGFCSECDEKHFTIK